MSGQSRAERRLLSVSIQEMLHRSTPVGSEKCSETYYAPKVYTNVAFGHGTLVRGSKHNVHRRKFERPYIIAWGSVITPSDNTPWSTTSRLGENSRLRMHGHQLQTCLLGVMMTYCETAVTGVLDPGHAPRRMTSIPGK